MSVKKSMLVVLVLFAQLVTLPLSSAFGSNLVIPFETDQPNFFGLGMGVYPDYIGSDDTVFGVAPLGRISLKGERYSSLNAVQIAS